MTTYDEQLAEFANEKKFQRLVRPLRGRADASCDACGSSQPRTLYGLKEFESRRFYFVGQNCLSSLTKLGSVTRGFCTDVAGVSFESEMESRGRESTTIHEEPLVEAHSSDDQAPSAKSKVQKTSVDDDPGIWPLLYTSVIREENDQYQAIVLSYTIEGLLWGWGWTKEPRFNETWKQAKDGSLVLEKRKTDRPGSLATGLERAAKEASTKQVPSQPPSSNGRSNHRKELWRLPHVLKDLLELTEVLDGNAAPELVAIGHQTESSL